MKNFIVSASSSWVPLARAVVIREIIKTESAILPACCRAAKTGCNRSGATRPPGKASPAISNVRCEGFTSNVAAGSAETTIRFDENIVGLQEFTAEARFTKEVRQRLARSRSPQTYR